MKKKTLLIGSLSILAVIILTSYWIGRARADVAETQSLSYSGILTDPNGMPLTGDKNVQLQVFPDQDSDSTTALCSVGPTTKTLAAGAFSVELPQLCVDAIHSHQHLWVELFVDGNSLGRSKLGAVPYALKADSASGALEQRIAALEGRTSALEKSSRGKLAGIFHYAAPPSSGCVSIKNTPGWTNVKETQVAFKVSKPVTIWATYSINVQPDKASGTEFVASRLAIDKKGAPVSSSHFQPFSTSHENLNLNGNYVGDLEPGEHVVKMQWRTNGSQRTWSNCPNWSDDSIGGRTIVVTALYK